MRDAVLLDEQCMRDIAALQEVLDGHPGPKMAVSALCFVVACVTAFRVYPDSDATFKLVTRVLAKIPDDIRLELCGPRLRPGRKITYRMIWHLKERIGNLARIDELGECAHDWSKTIDATRNGSLQNIQQLVNSVVSAAAKCDYIGMTAARALDSSSFEAHAKTRRVRGGQIVPDDITDDIGDEMRDLDSDAIQSALSPTITEKSKWTTLDPEAAAVHMPAKNGRRGYQAIGYAVHTTVLVPEIGQRDVPDLITQVTVRSGDTDYASAAVGLIKAAVAQGQKITEVLGDQGFSSKVPESYAKPLYQMGINCVYDLPKRNAVNRYHGGAVERDGDLFCPSAPDLTNKLPRISKGASIESQAGTIARYERREAFRFAVRAHNVDDHGSCRVECPARRGTVICDLVDSSARGSSIRPVAIPSANPGTACTNATVTMSPEFAARRQRHAYGTMKHVGSTNRRTGVERGYSKGKRLHGKFSRSTIQTNGLTDRLFLVGMKIAAGNFESLDAWDEIHRRK